MSALSERIARASFAQGVTTLLGKVVNVLLAIVLARLLFPRDYGVFAMAMIVTGLANMVSNFGFQSYIIQAKELTAEALNTCYTLNVVLSLILGAIVAVTGYLWPSPPPLLAPVLGLYGVHVLLSGLSYIELALLKRDFDFARSSRAELAYTAVSMGGRVCFAAAGLSALCFPLGDVSGSLVRWIIVRRMSTAKLHLAFPKGESSKSALMFGLHSTSLALASFVSNQTDRILLSANHAVAAVGLYSFGSTTAGLFYNAILVPQTGVFQATFARLNDDRPAARQVLYSATRLIFFSALPVSAILLLETERLLPAVFGAQWLESTPIVRIFAIDFLIRSMFGGITGIQMAFGLAAQAARTKWLNASVFVAVLLIATWMRVGIVGYAAAFATASVLATAHNAHVNGRILDVQWGSYALNLIPSAAIAVASTLLWFVARPIVVGWEVWPSFTAMVGLWLVSYIVLSLAFNREVIRTVASLLIRPTRSAVDTAPPNRSVPMGN